MRNRLVCPTFLFATAIMFISAFVHDGILKIMKVHVNLITNWNIPVLDCYEQVLNSIYVG